MEAMMQTDDIPIPAPRCTACRTPFRQHPERELCGRCYDEMAEWVPSHGTFTLAEKLARAEHMPVALFRMYIGERLRLEHKGTAGWHFDPTPTAQRHPSTQAERDALAAAQAIFPEAELRYLRVPHRHRRGCRECPRHDWQGAVLVATFHHVQILRRLP